ncbi:hypothetical protein C8P66_11524 [Humitalea rosea]|uniref:Uncharacterized protein n=1 Tax=Humitalea rosea TaxID=990373 RepID=A0A2W7IY28_9PROT|nr:hypothetical protein [Humitalea rosea]PZW43563.1 hypothetical protein C8P66_11524 [Humitalea rosea]
MTIGTTSLGLLGGLLGGLALLTACAAAGPPPPPADLPADSVTGAEDPTRAAIFATAYAFGAPSRLAGRPADAAEAVARLEYLATEIPTGPRWVAFDPTVGLMLRQGAAEARQVLGIPPDAAPQRVIDALYAAHRALAADDRAGAAAALPPAVFPAGAEATLARLAALPALPAAAAGTQAAQRALTRPERRSWPLSGRSRGDRRGAMF